MSTPFRVFCRSELWTQCEECTRTFDLSRLGACPRCRRVLCHAHLYGSFFRRLLVDLGSEAVCLKCRESMRSVRA